MPTSHSPTGIYRLPMRTWADSLLALAVCVVAAVAVGAVLAKLIGAGGIVLPLVLAALLAMAVNLSAQSRSGGTVVFDLVMGTATHRKFSRPPGVLASWPIERVRLVALKSSRWGSMEGVIEVDGRSMRLWITAAQAEVLKSALAAHSLDSGPTSG